MRFNRAAKTQFIAALLISALSVSACGDASSPSEPSPAAIDTAEAASRRVTIAAAFSTTPVPEDDERDEPIALDGRVFGDGDVGVILAHMRPSDQTSWFPFATKLAATGRYTVLTFDFRGYNDSTGEKEFDRVDTDLEAALAYMRGDLGIDKVFLIGASMGGTAALLVGAREDIAGVASLSALARFQQIDALTTIPMIDAPKLFISSADDIPAQASHEQFWAQALDPREQEIYEGNAHGTDLLASPSGPSVEQRLIDFLSEH